MRHTGNFVRVRAALLALLCALALLSPHAAPARVRPTQEGPPKEQGEFREPDLVELIKLDSSIKLDVRYATPNNFAGRAVYKEARAFLQRPAAEALVRAGRALAKKGYGLAVFDGYRPWSVTKLFWDITPADRKQFVADPSKGSRHNRGCAVDLTLYDLKTGRQVSMPGDYDEMSERSHADYAGGTPEQRRLRDLLRSAMEVEGFNVYPPEWWHYDYKDWRSYPILDLGFDEIGKPVRKAARAAHTK
jgi:D-alanyl-D-alanine dipeptidase